MKLVIDSTTNTTLFLQIGEKRKTITYDSPRSQDTLKAIDVFLREEDLEKKDLTSIEVNTGPGNFTSIRTSIAIAQALSLALQIPINDKPPGSIIEAEYGKAASITQRKK